MSESAGVREHDNEPLPGLPETLPAGERLLWQGSPDFLLLARRALHVNKVIAWFAVIALWRSATHWQATGEWTFALWWTPAIALVVSVSLLLTMAWLYARTTIYSITSRRVTMRFGLAVQITMNIPFTQIISACTKEFSGNRGNIALRTIKGARVSHLVLWPNVRPWFWLSPQPMLCCIRDFKLASAQLHDAVNARGVNAAQRDEEQSSLLAGAQGT